MRGGSVIINGLLKYKSIISTFNHEWLETQLSTEIYDPRPTLWVRITKPPFDYSAEKMAHWLETQISSETVQTQKPCAPPCLQALHHFHFFCSHVPMIRRFCGLDLMKNFILKSLLKLNLFDCNFGRPNLRGGVGDLLEIYR